MSQSHSNWSNRIGSVSVIIILVTITFSVLYACMSFFTLRPLARLTSQLYRPYATKTNSRMSFAPSYKYISAEVCVDLNATAADIDDIGASRDDQGQAR
jgi:hypothetical protein